MSFAGLGISNQSVSQANRVAEELLRRIRENYAVGDRLPSERTLADQFGVSRPVVREALRTLVMLQVIDVQVGRGAFVLASPELAPSLSSVDPSDLLDVIDVRYVIETGALGLAQQRADATGKRAVGAALRKLERAVEAGTDTAELDRELHSRIIAASRSPMLIRIWRGVEREVALSIRLSPKGQFMSPEILEQHRRLAAGVTEAKLDDALAAAKLLHEDNREFVRQLRRENSAHS